MGAYAPEYSHFLPIPNTLGAYAPEKVPQAHFSAIFALLIFTYYYFFWWISDINLDLKRICLLFEFWI